MDTKDIKNKYITRDRAVRILSKDGRIRVVAVKTSNSSLTAQKNHNLPLIPAIFLSKMLSAGALMASMLKGEERIILHTESDGEISSLYAEALQVGELRGYARYSSELDNLDFNENRDYLGNGVLKAHKILYNKTEPISSVIPIQSGNIESEVAYYFMKSEQIPTAALIDCSSDSNGNVIISGGVLAQALPGATANDIEVVTNALLKADRITNYYASHLKPEEVLREILPFEFDVIKNSQLDFFCRCSKERFLNRLISLTIKEIEEMRAQGANELVCRYCNKKYTIEPMDFENLLKTLIAKTN